MKAANKQLSIITFIRILEDESYTYIHTNTSNYKHYQTIALTSFNFKSESRLWISGNRATTQYQDAFKVGLAICI